LKIVDSGDLRMDENFNASKIIGKTVKISGEKELGIVVSFIMDTSGRIVEVLVERRGALEKYPAEMLQVRGDEAIISSLIEKKIENLSESLPIVRKKRMVLEKLSKEKIIPQEIFKSLMKKFDGMLKELENEAKSLIDEIDEEARLQEEYVKSLQMGRAFLEIERAMENISEEVYKRSIVALLRDVKNAQQKRLELLREKERINALLEEKTEEIPEKEKEETGLQIAKEKPEEEKGEEGEKAIPVRLIPE